MVGGHNGQQPGRRSPSALAHEMRPVGSRMLVGVPRECPSAWTEWTCPTSSFTFHVQQLHRGALFAPRCLGRQLIPLHTKGCIMSTSRLPVAVIGAGPVGLAAA